MFLNHLFNKLKMAQEPLVDSHSCSVFCGSKLKLNIFFINLNFWPGVFQESQKYNAQAI